MLSLPLREHDDVEIDGSRFRFARELGGDRALFVRDGAGGELILTERQVEDAIAGRRFRHLRALKDARGRRSPRNDDAEVGPDGPTDPRARARAFYAREWDRDPCARSTKELAAFVARLAPKARAAGLSWAPSAGALRRALRDRGEPGNRPLRVMQGRTGKAPGRRFPEFVEGLLARAVGFYYGSRRRTVTDAYAYLRGLLAVVERLAPARFPGWRPLAKPTYETLRCRVRNAECRDAWARKFSPEEARRRFRGTEEGLSASRILELVAIDSTVDDVVLIDIERMLPLGKPTLTVALDVHSRMPLAVVVTFEPMSLHTAMSALVEVNTPKGRWRDDDPTLTRDFDGWGKPGTVVVDNAWEQVGVSFQDACEDAGTNVEWAPIHNPEYKAVVERFIQTLQTQVTHKMEGSAHLPAHLLRKIGLDPAGEACIDIGSYRRNIRRWVVESYQMEPHGGIGRAPALAWRRSKETHQRQFIGDLGQLAASFGKVAEATVTREGVRYRNLRFHDPEVTTSLLDGLANSTPYRGRRTGSATVGVKIKYDPGDCGRIQVWNPVAKRYVELPNVDRAYVGKDPLSWAQHDLVTRFAREENLAFFTDEEKWLARNKLRAEIERHAGMLKLADMRRARRVLHPPVPVADTVRFGHVRPSVGGLGPHDVEVAPGARDRADGGHPEPGARRGGKRSKSKRSANGARASTHVPQDSSAGQSGGAAEPGPVDAPCLVGIVEATASAMAGRGGADWVEGRRRGYDG